MSYFAWTTGTCIHLLRSLNFPVPNFLEESSAGLSLLLTYLHWDRSVLSWISETLLATYVLNLAWSFAMYLRTVWHILSLHSTLVSNSVRRWSLWSSPGYGPIPSICLTQAGAKAHPIKSWSGNCLDGRMRGARKLSGSKIQLTTESMPLRVCMAFGLSWFWTGNCQSPCTTAVPVLF